MLYIDIPPIPRVILSIFCFVALVFSMNDFVRVFRTFRNKLPALIPVILSFVYLFFLQVSIFCINYNNDSFPADMKGYDIGYSFATKKAVFYIVALGIALVISILSFVHTVIKNRNELSLKSVKEAFDKLSTGLCYSAPGGYIVLINKKMQELSVALTGKTVTNAKQFYFFVKEKGDIVKIGDENFYMFTKKQLKGSKDMYELIAMDVTEETLLREELERQKKINREFNERLARFSKETGEVTVKQEVLNAKINIHDNLGNALIMSKRYLSKDDTDITLDEILEKWNKITFLEGTLNERKDKNITDDITAAAKACGIELVVRGTIPNNDTVRTLLFNGVRESLTNALKHADADIVFIDVSDDEGTTVMQFTNDGLFKPGPVNEGGGLTSLRNLVENNGGEMIISNEDRFCLTIRLRTQE
ncbi:MAG: sensor histidine kinase [Clostridiales bacterium]|nr:sensor histidine kinase [Clostridiales bacterium]